MPTTLTNRRRDPGPIPSGIGQAVRDRWGIAVVVVTWAWVCVPKIIQSLLAPKYRVAAGGESPYSRIAALADQGLYYALIGLCVLVVIAFASDLPRNGGLGLGAMLLPWFYMVVRDLYVGVGLSDESVVYPLLVVALWIVRPRFETLAVLGYLVGGTAALSILLALGLPNRAIYQTQDGALVAAEKALLPIGVLVGIFTQGNILGQFLCLGLPMVFLIRRVGHGRILIGLTVLALVWTASRGSLITAGIGLLVYILMARGSIGLRRFGSWTAPMVVFLVTAVVPFLTTDDRAFSNRGLIWTQSLRGWVDQPWLGLGINWYDLLGRSSGRIAGSARHGHNQLIQLLVTGGVVMVALVVLQLVAVMTRASRMALRGQHFGVVWISMFAASGLFERTLAYVDNGNFLVTVVVPMAFLLFCAPPATHTDPGTPAGPVEATSTPAERQPRSNRTTTSSGPIHRPVARKPSSRRNFLSARTSSAG